MQAKNVGEANDRWREPRAAMGEINVADRHRLLAIARDSLRVGNYQDRLIRSNWDFADVFVGDEPSRSVSLAAFGQDPPSYRTACWGITIGDDQQIQDLRALGAPQILRLDVDSVSRWKIQASGPPELQDRVSPERLVDLFKDRRNDWGPSPILRLKGVPLDLSPYQLDFYDAGLIPAIDEVVFAKLDRVLRRAITLAHAVYSEHSNEEADEGRLVRLVFRLLASKVFSDREYPGIVLGEDVADALAISGSYYGHSDSLAPALGDRELQAVVWREIRSSFNLQNISVEALAHVYENTLVTAAHRRATGTHATPPSLAEYIARRLPFESLPEDQRRVFEPFAGHAVFLVAAMGRLRELLPHDITAEQRHAYFVQSLTGIEGDPFALEVAQLSLLLADYPNPDGWNVHFGDVFTNPRTQQLVEDATIVLCNPPFEWFDQASRSKYERLRIANPAVEILNRVLASPPALLGFVLPWSFVGGQSYRATRQRLKETYGHLEVVGLPDSVFKYSQVEPVLLLASEFGKSPTSFHCAEVKRENFKEFARTWKPNWSTDSIIDRDENAPILWRHPLDRVWDELGQLPRLHDVTSIHRGVEYKLSLKKHQDELVQSRQKPGFVAGLVNVRDGYEQYFVQYQDYLNLSPDLILYQAHRNPWDQPKVIVNAARISRGPWKLAAVPDHTGLVCYQRFHGVWPKTGLSVELLAAVLNGYVANAYVGALKGSRDVTVSRLEGIPVPVFLPSTAERIEELVTRYRALRSQLASGGLDAQMVERCEALLAEIDTEVLGAYALPPLLEQEVLREFRGRPRRPVLRSLRDQARTDWLRPIALPWDAASPRTEEEDDLTYGTHTSRTIRRVSSVLGQRIAAIIAGVQDQEFEAWLQQEAEPPPNVRERLETALEVVQLLIDQEAADTIQAWFVGKNRMLGERAPAVVLGENPGAVLRAARAFAAYG